jgi:hypothetical protein
VPGKPGCLRVRSRERTNFLKWVKPPFGGRLPESWAKSSGQVPSQLGNDEGKLKATVFPRREAERKPETNTRADRTG